MRTARKKSTAKRVAPQAQDKTIFELIAEKCDSIETPVETAGGVVTVRNRIGFGDMTVLINTVVDMCTDDTNGEILWEIVDYTTKVAICVSYCSIRGPRGVEAGYTAVCGENGLYAQIVPHIDGEQLTNIFESVQRRLLGREALNQSTAVGRLNEMIQSVNELMKMIEAAADGYNSDDAIKALQSLATITGGK